MADRLLRRAHARHGGEKYAALTQAEEKKTQAQEKAEAQEPPAQDNAIAATVEMTDKLNFSPSSITVKSAIPSSG